MNQSILIRCAAAALAAVVSLPAQSAPVAPPKAATAGPQGPEKANVQSRLSAVIELLAKDDLSPEQRAEAKKALEEIATQLRRQANTPVTRPRNAGPADGAQDPESQPAKAPKPSKAPKPPKAPRVSGEMPPEPVEPPPAPAVSRMRVSHPVEVEAHGEPVEIIEVGPEGHPSVAVIRRRAAEESRRHAEVARVDAERAAEAGRVYATRARSEAARKAEVDAKVHSEHMKVYRAHQDPEAKGGDVWTTVRPARTRKVEIDDGDGDAELRAMIEEMRKEMREIRELMQQLRSKAQDRATGQGVRSGSLPSRGMGGMGMGGASSGGLGGDLGAAGPLPPADARLRRPGGMGVGGQDSVGPVFAR